MMRADGMIQIFKHGQSLCASAATMIVLSVGIVVGQTATARAEPAFVGTWAANRAACSKPQSQAGAPMIITARGFDQHETHCRFFRTRHRLPGAWTVSARCAMAGDSQQHTFTLWVSRQRLRFGDAKGTRILVKC